MDQNLVYVKTPIGDEAVRQSTRVVQRNLRMVLVQVDGKLTTAELAAKIGNVKLVESALRELEEGGFISPAREEASLWDKGKESVQAFGKSSISQFSSFGQKSTSRPDSFVDDVQASAFSTFGKPILPVEPASPAVEEFSPSPQSPDERKTDGHPLPLKRILGLAGGVLVLVLAALLLFPYERFRPEIEAALSNTLQTKVRVGGVRLGLLPRPQLLLSDIRIGDNADSKIEQIRLSSPLSLLLSGQSGLSEASVSDASMTADSLVAFSAGSGAGGLQRVAVERMAVLANDLAIRELSGEILFQSNGKMEKALLQTVDRSFRLVAVPSAQGLQLQVDAYGWRPDPGIAITFDSMQVKGLLQRGKLVVQDLDTTVLGGVIKGSWLLDWSNGLVMAGETSLARLDSTRIAGVFAPSMKLEGELGGNLRLRGAGRDWDMLWRNVEATLDATVSHGAYQGVDLGEATRRGAGYEVRSGSTKFDTLRAEVTLAPAVLRARNIQLNAGIMSATGQFASQRDGQIEGNFVVSMQSSVSTLRVPVKVSGNLPDLVAVSGR